MLAEGDDLCACGNCAEGCICPKCPKCSKRGEGCRICNHCATCCTSEESECGAITREHQHIEYAERGLTFYTPANALQRRRNPSTREISVELETNSSKHKDKGKKLHAALVKWGDGVVRDSSIGGGHEINTSPSGGDLFLDHMRDICDGFEAMGVDADNRCGMHVHVNCKDITFYDLRRVIMLYERVERALFDACHPRRLNASYSLKCGDFFSKNVKAVDPKEFKNNIYSQLYNGGRKLTKKPSYSSYSGWEECYSSRACDQPNCPRGGHYGPVNQDRICRECFTKTKATHRLNQQRGKQITQAVGGKSNTLRSKNIPQPTGSKSHGLRYKALNLHSYFYRGSIEFRHHEGTTDYNTIVGFARLCAALVDIANRMTEAQIVALPKNARRAMVAILPPDLHDFICGEWSKFDAIRNDKTTSEGRAYRETYKAIWGA